MSGSTIPHLYYKDYGNIKLPVPPLPEQQKIAAILSTVDEQINTTDKIIEKSKELKKGLMQKLLSEGIGHTEFKDTKIGRIPKDWELKKLIELISVKHGYAFKGEYFTNIPNNNLLLSPVNFKPSGGIQINWIKQKFYNSDEFPQEYILSEGDLIIAMTDLTPKCAILGSPAIVQNSDKLYLHNQRLGLVDIKVDELVQPYLFRYFNSSYFRNRMFATRSGTTVSHTSPKRIYDCLIALPSVKEQQKIAAVLSEADAKIQKEQTQKIQLEALKKGLMQQLLTGEKRGKSIMSSELHSVEIPLINTLKEIGLDIPVCCRE